MNRASLVRSIYAVGHATGHAAGRRTLGALMLAMGILGGCGGDTTPAITSYTVIQQDMQAKGCLVGSCHGKPGGTLAANKMILDTTAGQEMANFMVLISTVPFRGGKFVDTASPDVSQLLAVPLDSGHTGGKLFTGMQDLTYVKWRAWIAKGATFAGQ